MTAEEQYEDEYETPRERCAAMIRFDERVRARRAKFLAENPIGKMYNLPPSW